MLPNKKVDKTCHKVLAACMYKTHWRLHVRGQRDDAASAGKYSEGLLCSAGYDTGICENHVCVCKGRGGNVPIKNLASNFLADAKSAVEAAIGRVLSG